MGETELFHEWEELLSKVRHSCVSILEKHRGAELETDVELLEKLVTHHLQRIEESSVLLKRVVELDQKGELNTDDVTMLALWS